MSKVQARRRATLHQLDPTSTSTVIRMYRSAVLRKLAAIKSAIYKALVVQDVFGYKKGLMIHVELPPEKAWQALDLAGKNKAFAQWLQDVLTTYFLETTGVADSTPRWADKFLQAAYGKGVESAAKAVQRMEGSRETINLAALINTPFHQERLAQLFDRNFTELKGFTEAMATRLKRDLADGLIRGDGPRTMALQLAKDIDISRSRAEMIARTEVIRTHAQGQLNSFERFGIHKVELEAEWITAEDDNVCPDCEDMSGQVFSLEDAAGMIPLHPNCRCSWLPVQP